MHHVPRTTYHVPCTTCQVEGERPIYGPGEPSKRWKVLVPWKTSRHAPQALNPQHALQGALRCSTLCSPGQGPWEQGPSEWPAPMEGPPDPG